MPVIRKDGKEEIAVDKKQLVFENYLDSRFNDFEYIASTKECILFQYDFGDKMAEYDRRSKKFSKIEYNNVPLRAILYIKITTILLCFLPHSEAKVRHIIIIMRQKKCRKLQEIRSICCIRQGKTNCFLQL